MIETLFQRIQRHEGLMLTLYHDSLGFATIGYGHKCSQNDVDLYMHGITECQAITLLNDDLNECETQLFDAFPWMLQTLDEVRQGIFAEMAYQLGVHGVSGFTNTLEYAKIGNYDSCAQGMLDSEWHKQTPERCEELASLMISGGGDAPDNMKFNLT